MFLHNNADPHVFGCRKVPPSVRVETCEDSTVVGLARPVTERARKCSIVTEEEDDVEDRGSGGSHSSLHRRGSRSEGRLHLAVQELRRETVPVTTITEVNTPFSVPVH